MIPSDPTERATALLALFSAVVVTWESANILCCMQTQ